jgi:hypothetical protein
MENPNEKIKNIPSIENPNYEPGRFKTEQPTPPATPDKETEQPTPDTVVKDLDLEAVFEKPEQTTNPPKKSIKKIFNLRDKDPFDIENYRNQLKK